jgi:hypothetical protein
MFQILKYSQFKKANIMIKKVVFMLVLFVYTTTIQAQTKGLFVSINYDTLANISQPHTNQQKFGWLNSSYGFTLGWFINKRLNDRFILSSKALYQFRSFKQVFDDKLAAFHHIGIDESFQFRLRYQGNLFATAGIGVAYRLPTSFKNLELNSIDVYANLGLKYQIKSYGIVAQFSPSLIPLSQFQVGSVKFNSLFRTVQLGVEIPLK